MVLCLSNFDLDDGIVYRFHECLEPIKVAIAIFMRIRRNNQRRNALSKICSTMICSGRVMTKDRVSFLINEVSSGNNVSYPMEAWPQSSNSFAKIKTCSAVLPRTWDHWLDISDDNRCRHNEPPDERDCRAQKPKDWRQASDQDKVSERRFYDTTSTLRRRTRRIQYVLSTSLCFGGCLA